MDKSKLFIIILGIFIVILVAVGFQAGANPLTQKGITFDNIRMRHISDVRYKVENYFQINKTLPSSLADLELSDEVKDPETKQNYEYKMVDSQKYELCTTFSTESKDSQEYYPPGPYGEITHSKGYDCLTFVLPDYMK